VKTTSKALEDVPLVREAAGVVDRVPPQHEAELLAREAQRAAVFRLQELGPPTGDLPPERLCRELPGTVCLARPGGAEKIGSKVLISSSVSGLSAGTAHLRRAELGRGERALITRPVQ
jgi:hypothetical protein